MSRITTIALAAIAVPLIMSQPSAAGNGGRFSNEDNCYQVRTYGFVGTSDIAQWHWKTVCKPVFNSPYGARKTK